MPSCVPLFHCVHAFAFAQNDEFHVTCRDIGRVQSIIIESNGLSSNPNWHLDMVVVQVGGKACFFCSLSLRERLLRGA